MQIECNERHEYFVDGIRRYGVTEILSAQGLIDLFGIPPHALVPARELGKNVHLACQIYNLGKMDRLKRPLDPVTQSYLNGWIKFVKEHQVEIINTEQMLYSAKWGFCGTYDGYGMVKGKRTMIDIKTNTTIDKFVVGVQTAGYKILFEDNYKDKIQQRLAVQLKPDDYKPYPCTDLTDEGQMISAITNFKGRLKNNKLKSFFYEREIFSKMEE